MGVCMNHIEKLKRELFILKNINAHQNSSTKEKEKAVQEFTNAHTEYTFYEVCRAINLNKGTYYNFLYNRKEVTFYDEHDKIVNDAVIKICEDTKNRLGSTKIKIELLKLGIHASITKIVKILKEQKIGYQYTKIPKRSNKRTHRHYFKRNLLNRDFNQIRPNAVWVSDFTEIKIDSAKFYICVILDLFSRKVISYRTSCKVDMNLALKTFKDAYEDCGQPNDLIFHSDQGSQYLSHAFQDTLKALGVNQSFSDPATPYDNAVIESFFSNFKREEVYKHKYRDYEDLINCIDDYIDFYNNKRPHKTLNYKTPTDFENDYYNLI